MSHHRKYAQQPDDEYYNSRSSSRRQNGNYDQQGNPYAYYGEQQPSPDYGYGYQNDYGREQQVARPNDRGRYHYSDEEDDVSARYHRSPIEAIPACLGQNRRPRQRLSFRTNG